jgi:hypothetical protein
MKKETTTQKNADQAQGETLLGGRALAVGASVRGVVEHLGRLLVGALHELPALAKWAENAGMVRQYRQRDAARFPVGNPLYSGGVLVPKKSG